MCVNIQNQITMRHSKVVLLLFLTLGMALSCTDRKDELEESLVEGNTNNSEKSSRIMEEHYYGVDGTEYRVSIYTYTGVGEDNYSHITYSYGKPSYKTEVTKIGDKKTIRSYRYKYEAWGEEYSDENWETTISAILTYDSQNRILEERHYDEEGNEQEAVVYTYTGTGKENYTYLRYFNGSLGEKGISIRKNNKTTEMSYKYLNGSWVESTRSMYVYDNQNRLIESHHYDILDGIEFESRSYTYMQPGEDTYSYVCCREGTPVFRCEVDRMENQAMEMVYEDHDGSWRQSSCKITIYDE